MTLGRFLLFNLWYYLKRPPWDTGISPPELIAFLEEHPPGRALDLGCGTGTNVIHLAKNGWQAFGVDFAWKAIATARRKSREAGVQAVFRVGDVSRVGGFSEPFDLVLDIGCYHSLPADSRRSYRENLPGLLRPGGSYLLYAFLNENERPGSGISEAEIGDFASALRLVSRQEGRDRAGDRRSVWLTFERPPATELRSTHDC